MRNSRLTLASLGAIMSLGMGLASAASVPASIKAPPPHLVAQDLKAARRLSFGGIARAAGRRRGPGWTHAHVQRMARKRRNQARHKAACRRAGG